MSPNLTIPHVTQQDITTGLRKLNLSSGDGVMVHSSLKSFGHVEGGASTVVAALMEVLSPDGTLLLPSFNHGAPFHAGGPGLFDPTQTPTANGAIPDYFWRMLGVFRSLNPTHAFAAWGKHAQRYTALHHRTLTMGSKSPLGLLYADDGYGLLLGVGYHANTFHHMVEMTTGAPCLGRRTEAYPMLLPDGRRVEGRTWGWRAQACPITDHAIYAAEMETRGLQTEVLIGSSRVILFRLRDCFELIAKMLREGQNGFSPCRECPIRPRHVPQTTPSDWDSRQQRLKPDSPAWQY